MRGGDEERWCRKNKRMDRGDIQSLETRQTGLTEGNACIRSTTRIEHGRHHETQQRDESESIRAKNDWNDHNDRPRSKKTLKVPITIQLVLPHHDDFIRFSLCWKDSPCRVYRDLR